MEHLLCAPRHSTGTGVTAENKIEVLPSSANILVERGDRVCWEEMIPLGGILKGLTEMLMFEQRPDR